MWMTSWSDPIPSFLDLELEGKKALSVVREKRCGRFCDYWWENGGRGREEHILRPGVPGLLGSTCLLLQPECSCHLQPSLSGFHKEPLITPHRNTFLSPPPRGKFCPLQPNEPELQCAKGKAMSLPVWRRMKDKWTMEHLVLLVVLLVLLVCFC